MGDSLKYSTILSFNYTFLMYRSNEYAIKFFWFEINRCGWWRNVKIIDIPFHFHWNPCIFPIFSTTMEKIYNVICIKCIATFIKITSWNRFNNVSNLNIKLIHLSWVFNKKYQCSQRYIAASKINLKLWPAYKFNANKWKSK